MAFFGGETLSQAVLMKWQEIVNRSLAAKPFLAA